MKSGYMHCDICELLIKLEESTKFVLIAYNTETHKDYKRTTLFLCNKCSSKTKAAFEEALERVKDDREAEEYWMS